MTISALVGMRCLGRCFFQPFLATLEELGQCGRRARKNNFESTNLHWFDEEIVSRSYLYDSSTCSPHLDGLVHESRTALRFFGPCCFKSITSGCLQHCLNWNINIIIRIIMVNYVELIVHDLRK